MAKGRSREPLKEGEKRKLNKKNLRKVYGVFKYVLPYKKTFILGMIALSISSSVLLALPYVVGKIVDEAQGVNTWFVKGITNLGLLLLGILFVQSIFSFLRIYLFARFSENSMADLRKALFSKFLSLPMSFYDQNRVGELVSRLTADISQLQTTFTTTLAEFFRQIITLVVGTTVIFIMTPQLSLFMLATLPLIIIVAMVFGKFIRKMSRKTQDHLAATNVIAEESMHGIQAVKAFVNEKYEYSRFGRSVKELVGIAIKTSTYQGLFVSFIIFFLMGGIIGVIWYGATLVQDGVISMGDLTSFVFFTAFMGGSIAGIGNILTQIQRSVGASERVLEIIDEDGEPSRTEGEAETTKETKLSVSFENVSFAYPTRKEMEVLKDVNFKINPGQKVALVGPSGAGKSTITQLIMRFYNPDCGVICVGETNIQSIDLESYRSLIGVVPQEVILFGGTIRENIAYGNPEASEEAIVEAAKKANALEFINSFPDGFNTMVGERGVKLSGGQRQRIAIARAILKDPKLLILDEATSALDAESEYLIQDALEKLMADRTTIIVAHRLGTIKKADNIFVIENGVIAESGTHKELKQKDQGVYRNLVQLQLQD
ncbi:ABC transporter transmembrane domain-containing protein [Mangrovivirga sp. M17]|uniref:ABC transporter transmembrane domain-containing protein n=1 Tax=Mangrovivirga halotolerans TaxID=2993936 RepID=A0ABT3RSH6_9BACT|nr:ABC transporter transmembrane domain-containing protein [Mangrovivirga halotolerans]MCX2744585.1 ABC transporter transmembrane domain-containing protein [Mangrovivirga halotolerans]